jgi:glycosyltransferase involved in cell wall biosynthesis
MALNWQFDAIVIQNSMAGYSAVPDLRRALPQLRIVDFVHAVDPAWDFVSSTMAIAGQIDIRVVISEGGRKRLLGAGIPPEKIRLIRNGIDLERFRPVADRGSKKILFAGRLDPVKRPALLADIAVELWRLRPAKDYRFLVAGDGPEAGALRSRVARAGVEALFTMLGMVEDMPPLLAEADVVVVPSQAEGIPLIVLEAFAVGRPVVCARAGAAAEAVDAETGVLIDPGPQEAARFAAALHQLLDDPARRRSMGEAARRKIETDYSRARAQQAYRDVLEVADRFTFR